MLPARFCGLHANWLGSAICAGLAVGNYGSGANRIVICRKYRISPRKRLSRRTIVATTLPLKLQPSKGVFLDFECDCEASKVHFFFGSKMVTSACEPLASVPRPSRLKIFAGFEDSSSTIAPQRQLEVLVQHGDGDGQRRLQAGDAEGGALELDLLLVKGVGRMVGGDGVDGAVENAFDQGVAVGGGTQRRIHFVVGVELADVLVHQRDVVRRDFGRSRAARPSWRARTASSASRVERCATCTCPLVARASAMSRSTMLASAAFGMPCKPRRNDVGPKFIEQPTVRRVSSACCTTGIFSRCGRAQGLAHQPVVEDRLAIVADRDRSRPS